jgi:hypothetical protein
MLSRLADTGAQTDLQAATRLPAMRSTRSEVYALAARLGSPGKATSLSAE